jgi:hypothetical protein
MDQHVTQQIPTIIPPSHIRRTYSDQQKINREVSLMLKHGVEAKNYEDLAKAEKLKPLEVELRRLEDLSDAIVQDFAYMRQREEEMRDTNGKFEQFIAIIYYFPI